MASKTTLIIAITILSFVILLAPAFGQCSGKIEKNIYLPKLNKYACVEDWTGYGDQGGPQLWLRANPYQCSNGDIRVGTWRAGLNAATLARQIGKITGTMAASGYACLNIAFELGPYAIPVCTVFTAYVGLVQINGAKMKIDNIMLYGPRQLPIRGKGI